MVWHIAVSDNRGLATMAYSGSTGSSVTAFTIPWLKVKYSNWFLWFHKHQQCRWDYLVKMSTLQQQQKLESEKKKNWILKCINVSNHCSGFKQGHICLYLFHPYLICWRHFTAIKKSAFWVLFQLQCNMNPCWCFRQDGWGGFEAEN